MLYMNLAKIMNRKITISIKKFNACALWAPLIKLNPFYIFSIFKDNFTQSDREKVQKFYSCSTLVNQFFQIFIKLF